MSELKSVTLIAAKEVWPEVSNKTQILAVNTTRYLLPIWDGHSLTNIFVDLEIHFGRQIGYCKERDILLIMENE